MEYTLYGDALNGAHIYDEFLGKWVKNYKTRRKTKKAIKSRKPLESPAPPRTDAIYRMEKIPPKAIEISMTKKEARMHRNNELAKQMEYKTKEAELKALEQEKKVEQEDLKARDQKHKTRMMNLVGGVVLMGLVGFGGFRLIKSIAANAEGAKAPKPK